MYIFTVFSFLFQVLQLRRWTYKEVNETGVCFKSNCHPLQSFMMKFNALTGLCYTHAGCTDPLSVH